MDSFRRGERLLLLRAGSSTLVWRLQALRRRALLLSADSRGRITVWALPAGVALQTLHVHVADVLDIQLVECTDSWLAGSRGQDAPPLPTNEEVVLSVGVDGKLSAISRTEVSLRTASASVGLF